MLHATAHIKQGVQVTAELIWRAAHKQVVDNFVISVLTHLWL